MGLFGNLFGGNSSPATSKRELPWLSLNSEAQLEDIAKRSQTKTQIIFKHSTTCGISRMVLGMFTDNYGLLAEEAELYFLDLHVYRPVSNAVAERFQVLHQSPQLLVIKNGAVVFHTSHGAITEVDVKQFA